MATMTIAVHIPEPLFQRLKRAVELTHRSVEEVTATSLAVALPAEENLPLDIANELAVLPLFNDDVFMSATAPSFSPTEQYRLNQLNAVAGNET